MNIIDKQYIVDENNKKIAVQIGIETFEKIEQILEDYALFNLMKGNSDSDLLELNGALKYYDKWKTWGQACIVGFREGKVLKIKTPKSMQ